MIKRRIHPHDKRVRVLLGNVAAYMSDGVHQSIAAGYTGDHALDDRLALAGHGAHDLFVTVEPRKYKDLHELSYPA